MATTPDHGSAETGAVVGDTRWASTAALLDARRSHRRGQGFVALAAVAWSTAGVLQRGLSVGAATQVGVRAVFAGLALLAYVAAVERGRVASAFRSAGGAGIGVALALAAASASFIVALNHTTVAHVLFIQAMAPVLAALLARVALGEPIAPRTAAAMALALAGVAVMVGGPGGGDPVGDGLSLTMAMAFAVAIVITRHRRDVSMAPATCLAQVVLVAAFLPFAHAGDVPGDDLLALAALGAGQIGLGLVFLTIGARLIPAAQVALISLLEVVLGPLWVWMAVDERPSTATLIGGAVVVAAVVIQARGGAPPAREPVADAAGRASR
jgi:drug/metabolite transporter (DMT)-like permease